MEPAVAQSRVEMALGLAITLALLWASEEAQLGDRAVDWAVAGGHARRAALALVADRVHRPPSAGRRAAESAHDHGRRRWSALPLAL
eukprot:CAMPEP_0119480326 /NCGR_PEP_ID=MMETSP1344-20130328/9184_1 /TAXON_ID=236787 /ORGANISM="Florenciella parvula, Strain CCMP2471" /LENGTH=86 /DNA_ID=CAMNT_0007514623 /DNA_START=102 /DNA_END=359 /DNA_ORIENTATION=-